MTVPLRRAAAAAAVTALLAGGLAACGPAREPVASPAPTQTAPVPAGLESFYSQKLDWGGCDKTVTDKNAQCATIKAPLDYAAPEAKTIDVALARIPAAGPKIGSLFLNPGGPGASGIEFLSQVAGLLPPEIADSYDLVGFDPRGVGRSTPVTCFDDAKLSRFLDGTLEVPASDPAWDKAREVVAELGETATDDSLLTAARIAAFAAACQNNSGDLLAHVDTVSAARDLDLMRAVAGDDELYYLGYSYGTFLGTTYIDLFPANVGRMVLDGVLAAGMTMDEVALSQGVGMEASLRHFVEFCQGGSTCPLSSDTDTAMKQIADFVAGLASKPLRTANPDRPLTVETAVTGLIGPLYSTAAYPALREGLRQALTRHDGTQLQAIADQYTGRRTDGSFESNSNAAFLAINMVDYPIVGTPADWQAWMTQLGEKAPLLAADGEVSALGQLAWPVRSSATRTYVKGEGAAPVLLVSTLHDPATPHEMALATHEHLASSRLITLDGWDHTTLAANNPCVTDAVVDYLIEGVVPDKDLACH